MEIAGAGKASGMLTRPDEEADRSFFIFKFIYFIFGSAGSLLPCGLFFSCGERGPLWSCSAWASHCHGFCCGAQGLRGHSSFGSWTLEHRLSSCGSLA